MRTEVALARLQGGDSAGALTMLEASAPPGPNARYDAALGMVLLAENRPADALVALRHAATLGDRSPPTVLNLAIAEDRAGDAARASELMQDLERRLPDWDEPPLRLAESLRARGDPAAAEDAYARVLAVNPHREEALLALAGLLINRGDATRAQPLLMHCCGVAPHRAEAWDTLGIALNNSGESARAYGAFVKAQRCAPLTLDYALRRVGAAIKANCAEADLARLELDCEADPLNPARHIAIGVLLEHIGHRAAAIEAFETAVALAPNDPVAATHLGEALVRSTRPHDGEIALRRAVELDPDNIKLRNDHAATLMRMQRHGEARALLQSAIDDYGDDWQLLCNLANTTCCLGLQTDAAAMARRAIDRAPDALNPRRSLLGALVYQDGVPGADILAAARTCAERTPRSPAPAFANTLEPDRPLVIGLLSGTLKTHPVGWLTIGGLEALDPAAFAIVALAHNTWSDVIARRFRAVAREWHDIGALSDEEVARKGRDLGLDILIDLGGYGEGSRMSACAHRVAPVQIKWVGAQSQTTGLPDMDWMLTDRWETPPELAHLYTERLLHMPDGYVCYSSPPYAPDVAPLPAIANGYVTFGCFNNLAKVTPRVIATWCSVLHRVPNSRLVLKTQQFADPTTAERVRAAFAVQGIAPERLELRGPSGHRAFVGEYNGIDIVLDPFPYSGGLTTCEALWMGVPTVTVPGEIFAARHSVSHMSNAGLADWVAPDIPAYIELAVKKASDIEALAALRSRLRAQVKASPLCDAPRFGRSLGAALRYAWREWCEHATDR
ncbi:MAG: tetratricopeptide repeat protein [Acetobacteraceae bacterium]|jgi:protein O-GlcNAc transferase